MPLTKENADSVLPAVGNRSLRTVFRTDTTSRVNYKATDNAGVTHEAEFENTAALAWIANAIANPGTNAAIDALMVANPNFTAAYLAVAAAALRTYGDFALGFTETP